MTKNINGYFDCIFVDNDTGMQGLSITLVTDNDI